MQRGSRLDDSTARRIVVQRNCIPIELARDWHSPLEAGGGLRGVTASGATLPEPATWHLKCWIKLGQDPVEAFVAHVLPSVPCG